MVLWVITPYRIISLFCTLKMEQHLLLKHRNNCHSAWYSNPEDLSFEHCAPWLIMVQYLNRIFFTYLYTYFIQNWNGSSMFFPFPFFWRSFDSRHKISDNFLKLINITVVCKKQKFLVICTSYHITVVLSNSDQFYVFLGLNFCCQVSKGDALLCSWAVTINCLLDIGDL